MKKGMSEREDGWMDGWMDLFVLKNVKWGVYG